jgi:hypothetical protein
VPDISRLDHGLQEDMEDALERLDGRELDGARIRLYKVLLGPLDPLDCVRIPGG